MEKKSDKFKINKGWNQYYESKTNKTEIFSKLLNPIKTNSTFLGDQDEFSLNTILTKVLRTKNGRKAIEEIKCDCTKPTSQK